MQILNGFEEPSPLVLVMLINVTREREAHIFVQHDIRYVHQWNRRLGGENISYMLLA